MIFLKLPTKQQCKDFSELCFRLETPNFATTPGATTTRKYGWVDLLNEGGHALLIDDASEDDGLFLSVKCDLLQNDSEIQELWAKIFPEKDFSDTHLNQGTIAITDLLPSEFDEAFYTKQEAQAEGWVVADETE